MIFIYQNTLPFPVHYLFILFPRAGDDGYVPYSEINFDWADDSVEQTTYKKTPNASAPVAFDLDSSMEPKYNLSTGVNVQGNANCNVRDSSSVKLHGDDVSSSGSERLEISSLCFSHNSLFSLSFGSCGALLLL
ncbi:hypothetical protein P3S67_024000 [Capsicum chacoense]